MPQIAPATPGIPCKLRIPQVSCKPIFLYRMNISLLNPKVDIAPAKIPIRIANIGKIFMSAHVPF